MRLLYGIESKTPTGGLSLGEMVKDSIFVAVVAADELYLNQTINSIFNASSGETLIDIGVCVQNIHTQKQHIDATGNIKIVTLQHDDFFGVGLPRQIALSLISDQKYCLMVDGHMIFEPNWDLDLIQIFKQTKQLSSKNVISGRTMNWWFKQDGCPVKQKYDGSSKFNHFGLFLDTEIKNGSPSHKHGQPAVILKEDISRQIQVGADEFVVRQDVVSCNFLFGDSETFDEVMPDSKIIYTGDESTIGLRLLTRNYEIYTPCRPIAYHLLKQLDFQYSENLNWQPYHPKNNTMPSEWSARRHRESLQRIKQIFTGEIIGEWGSPSLEKLHDYEKRVNVSFVNFYAQLKCLYADG